MTILKKSLIVITLAAAALAASGEAMARGGRGGGWHGGGRGLGIGLGVGIGLGALYYGSRVYSPYYYPPPVYVAPPMYVEPPPVYIENAPPAAQAGTGPVSPWYFCASRNAYYPYTPDCPEGWQQVSPTPR